ncbi:TraC family protein [Bradyrhizobium sp. USDA 10063]
MRDEIARLQDQLKQAETREAERIGRIALKAGMGEIEIEEGALLSAFEEIASWFRKGGSRGAKAAAGVASGASSDMA